MLTLVRTLKSEPRKAVYRCDCGKLTTVWSTNVATGHTQSCGCFRTHVTAERSTTHGHKRHGKRTRTYVIWMNMKARCTRPTARLFTRYGGRGITFDPSWASFENFLRDMGEAPEGMTIDRIDNDGNYSASNCRWATRPEQAKNKSNVLLYEWRGERRSVAEWARVTGIDRLTLRYRLRSGWPVERALTERPR